MNTVNHEKWKELHTQDRYHPKYPLEEVVQFVFRNYERNGKTKILDAGCGAGRHVMFLANENIQPYGVDFSETGVAYTKELLHVTGYEMYENNIMVASCSQLPFGSEMFDAVLSVGVLYYLSEKEIRESVSEMSRVLKHGGQAFILIRSTEDYRCLDVQDSIDNNGLTGVVREQDESRSAFSENGMSMHFFTRDEIENLFEEWNDVKIDRIVKTHDNEKYSDVDYLVTACK